MDVKAVTEFASHLPGVVVAREYTYMCSDPGQTLIKKDIRELGLNRVVVASCSPRMHEPTFRAAVSEAGLNPYCFEMANIREQCSWVHPNEPATTLKAMQLVSSAVNKATHLEPLQVRQVSVTPSALVIGGGISGLQSAVDIADAGFAVTLVEQFRSAGRACCPIAPHVPNPAAGAGDAIPLVERVASHPQITVMTGSEVVGVSGYVGNFQMQVRRQGEEDYLCSGWGDRCRYRL